MSDPALRPAVRVPGRHQVRPRLREPVLRLVHLQVLPRREEEDVRGVRLGAGRRLIHHGHPRYLRLSGHAGGHDRI